MTCKKSYQKTRGGAGARMCKKFYFFFLDRIVRLTVFIYGKTTFKKTDGRLHVFKGYFVNSITG